MNPSPLARASSAALLAVAGLAANAQDATRIVAATVYPDSAHVDRALRVPGGTRHIVIGCLPAAVDLTTLQVDGDPDLRMGEIRITPLPQTRATECEPSSIESRQQALNLRREALEAQRDSDDLAWGYLRVWSANPHPVDPAGAGATATSRPLGASRPGALASDLRVAAQELLLDQARVRRELAALGREGDKLADEMPASPGKSGWRTVRFDVWTPATTLLHVRYNVANAYWRPTYRATMDVAHASVRIDRQADIVQASGEDWSDVHVTLSTGRAHRSAQARTPTAWFVDLAEPPRPSFSAMAAMPSAAPDVQRVEVTGSAIARQDAPAWGATMTNGDVASDFAIAQPVTLPSDGETHTLQLATQTLPATLQRRTTPRIDRAVYLVAQATRPAGSWPAGPLQSWLDGALVGRAPWQPSQGDQLEIALGQDDQMHVDVESPAAFTQAKGVFGSSTQRSSTAVYAVVNTHPDAVTVELLDASPVSRNEAIQVTHTYVPPPTVNDWNKVPGVEAWTLAVPAHETRRVSISHGVTTPKDTIVSNLP